MKVIIDIECNGLHNPTKLWVVVAKDVDTGQYHIFRNDDDFSRLPAFLNSCEYLIGHNYLGYDGVHLECLTGHPLVAAKVIDTLIISKLVNYPRIGHSVESYGGEFGSPKGDHKDFSKYSKELEEYCIRDVDITEQIYRKYEKYIHSRPRQRSIRLEHDFQLICNDLEKNGFAFNTAKAQQLLLKVQSELATLDADILSSFPPKEVLIREFIPRATKFGTISKTSVPRVLHDKIVDYEVGKTYKHTRLDDFNPSSYKQIIAVLNGAGWRPTEKTKTHIEVERAINGRSGRAGLTQQELFDKLKILQKTGWKITEDNLNTLPYSAPKPARLLAKRILLESRRRTLAEWLALVVDGRVHGRFQGLGAWTHRMAHQRPNTANIPNAVRVSDGKPSLYGKELRSFWCAPKNRLLVGVDAEAIQLRIFAHLINDPILTDAIVNGKKSEGTDPHSLNKKYFGEFCKTRNAAKHSLYAIFFGGGPGKIADIMACTKEEATVAIDSLIEKYPGLAYLQQKVIPADAKRGWFVGIDGRAVRVPGEDVGKRKHLMMSGYLQNGEVVAMKMASVLINKHLLRFDAKFVNLVHDEWQVEIPNNVDAGIELAKIMCDSLRVVGEELKLNCPLAGSYWSDDNNAYTIATNWSKTH